jgi:hypothetical protein
MRDQAACHITVVALEVKEDTSLRKKRQINDKDHHRWGLLTSPRGEYQVKNASAKVAST